MAAYAVVLIIGLAHHEMWRDELQLWLIGRDSGDIVRFLITGDTAVSKATGIFSCLPWYIFLYFLAFISHDPAVLQVFQFCLAVICAGLFIRFSPFGRTEKALSVFGYYMLFEYGMIARGYILGVLLLFVFAILFGRRPRPYLPLFAILLALCYTSPFGLVMAGAMCILLAADYLESSKGPEPMTGVVKTRFKQGILVFVAGIAVTFYLMVPPKDTTLAFIWFKTLSLERLYGLFPFLSASFFPVPELFTVHFWNTNLVVSLHSGILDLLFFLYALFILLYVSYSFYPKRGVLLSFWAAVSAYLLFIYLNQDVYNKFAPRHYGHIFLVYIVLCWLSHHYRESAQAPAWLESLAARFRLQRRHPAIFTALLAFQAAGGIAAWMMELAYPFSGIKRGAEILIERKLDRLPILATVDFAVSPLSAYLQRPLYYPEIDTLGTYVVWNLERIRFTDKQFTGNVHNYVLAHDSPVVLIFNYRPQVLAKSDIEFTLLDSTGPAVVADEALYIYLARKVDVLRLLDDSLSYLGDSAVAERFKETAIRLYEEGDWVKAGIILDTILAANPSARHYGLHVYLGRVYLRRGMPGLAQEAFTREAEQDLMTDEAYFHLGVMEFEKRDTFAAMRHWEKTIAENPMHVNAHNNLGVCFVLLGRHSEAEALWLRAVRLNPDYLEGYFNLVRLFYTLRNNNPGGEYDRKFLEYVRMANSRGITPEVLRSRGIQVPDEAVK